MRLLATILGFIFLLILPECENATHANSSLSEASNVKDSTLVRTFELSMGNPMGTGWVYLDD